MDNIADELWSVVAGRKAFADGDQMQLIHQVNDQLDSLMTSNVTSNPMELTVARRTMSTLEIYVNEMGIQMNKGAQVADNEVLLEEVRSVAILVGDMLGDFIVLEISDATQTSTQMQDMLHVVLIEEGDINDYLSYNEMDTVTYDFNTYPISGFKGDTYKAIMLNGEYPNYTWIFLNDAGVPMVGLSVTEFLPHGLYQAYVGLAWNFMVHYSRDINTKEIAYNPYAN